MKFKRCLIGVVAATGLLLLSLPGAAVERQTAENIDAEQELTPFGVIVQRNWQRWSQGKEVVSKLDLIAKFASPQYQDQDAAALVALEVFLRKTPSVDLVTAAAIDDDKILSIYANNVLKLRRAKRTLFANGQPNFELLQQGPPGDCYFFSATGWMAKNRPLEVVNAINPLTDGRFQVRFPNGDEATVSAPTDAELAVNDSDSTLQDGLWMSVLEKAIGMIQARSIARSSQLPDPTVAIDIPGVPIASIIKRWTGREVGAYTLGQRARREHVRAGLIRMHQRTSLATALLLHRPPAKLPFDHVYAIMDFDQDTDTVTLWNPWGTDFTPNGPSGADNGYERKKGIFYLSLDEFISFYTFLAIDEN